MYIYQDDIEDNKEDFPFNDWYDIQQAFDEVTNEGNEDIVIWGMIYSPAEVLKLVDPIAYRVTLMDYHNDLAEDGQAPEEPEGNIYV